MKLRRIFLLVTTSIFLASCSANSSYGISELFTSSSHRKPDTTISDKSTHNKRDEYKKRELNDYQKAVKALDTDPNVSYSGAVASTAYMAP